MQLIDIGLRVFFEPAFPAKSNNFIQFHLIQTLYDNCSGQVHWPFDCFSPIHFRHQSLVAYFPALMRYLHNEASYVFKKSSLALSHSFPLPPWFAHMTRVQGGIPASVPNSSL
jgi:hypothetical protein